MKDAYISFKEQGIFKLFCCIGIVLLGLFIITEFASAKGVSCGDTVTGNIKLRSNLDCSFFPVGSGPILIVEGPANLNLKVFTVIGNGVDTCIEVRDAKAKVWNGTVTQCGDGVVITGTGRHMVFRIKSMYNENTGFKIEENSNGNRLEKNEALGNKGSNFLIERGSDDNYLIKNKAEDGEDRGFYVRGSNNNLYKNKADGNYDDALRIRNGSNNKAIYNFFSNTESGEGVEIDAKDNIVRKNIIKQNNRGIRIRDDDNVVRENIILNNELEGIRVESSANLISNNIIKNNGFVLNPETEVYHDGLKLEEGAQGNILIRNLVFNNSGNGINVDAGATENNIEHNIAMRNGADDTYFDALDGNLTSDCGGNIWCENYFGTKYPDYCIDSEDCEDGDEDGCWHDFEKGGD